MSRSYAFTLFFLLLSPFLLYADDTKLEADSLLLIVRNTEKSKQLELLNDYVDLHPTNIDLIKALELQSSIGNNLLYQVLANRKYIYYYAVVGDRDSMKVYLDRTNKSLNRLIEEGDYSSLSKKDKIKFQRAKIVVVATKVTVYIDEGKYNIALNELNKAMNDPIINTTQDFKSQAYSLMGIAYLYTKKNSEALDCFLKADEIEKEVEKENKSKDTYIGKYRYYSSMEGAVIAYNALKQYQEASDLSQELKNKIEDEYRQVKILHGDNSSDDFVYNFMKNRILCYSALANVYLKDYKKARKDLDEVKKYVPTISGSSIHQDFDIYYIVETEYYLSVGNFDQAKNMAKSMTDRVTAEEHTYTYMKSHILLSRALNEEGRSKDAYDILYDLYNVNDSINAVNFSKEFAEMESRYDLAEAKLAISEANLRLKNTQKLLLVFGISFVLVIIIAIIIWRNKKLLKHKNISLYKQYKEIEARNVEILKLQSINVGVDETQTEKDEVNEKENQQVAIIKALDKYLLTTQAFLDPKISREDVAPKIGTNRQYLIEAIKDQTGKTFNEFIYTYRIKYAYNLIVNNKNKTISDVLEESGFHSRATFYNAFKEIYGMTPSELRSILEDKKIRDNTNLSR